MLKAALITPNFSLGGAERWIVQLLAHVDPQRVQWTGLVVSGHGGADPRLCEQAARHTTLHSNRVPAQQRRPGVHPFNPTNITHWHPDLWQAINAVTADADVVLTWGVVNAQGWYKNVPAIPRVCCAHGTLQESPLRPLTGHTHLVGVAEVALTYFDDRPGDTELPRQVIYNGVDDEHLTQTAFGSEQRALWGYGPDDVIVGCLGRQAPEKNYLRLAESLVHLPAKYRTVFYGQDQRNYGHTAGDLLAMQELFADRIRCYLPQERVGNILAGCDVLAIPSHREACSLTMLEAWLVGVPVVATPVGAVPELQRRFGQLVIETPLDPSAQELAAAIERAAGEEGRQLALRAMDVACEHFTIKTMADNWAAYLEQVCSY